MHSHTWSSLPFPLAHGGSFDRIKLSGGFGRIKKGYGATKTLPGSVGFAQTAIPRKKAEFHRKWRRT